ncbi:hypothetical protein DFQ29_009928, partial [Apophysomyces sp. BC1021]
TRAEFMTLDCPAGYICRLVRTPHQDVPNSINEFSKLLMLLGTALKMKVRISRTMDAMNMLQWT